MQDPGLKMQDTIALASVLTLKSDQDLPLASYHSQSNLKSPQTLATTKMLTHFIISIAVLQNVLKMRDTIALASVLTLKSDLDLDLPLASYHSQSNLKSPQTYATTIF
jgi:hypothetical protein